MLILVFSFVSSGCNQKATKDFFKVESKYDIATTTHVDVAKQSGRVGNVIYLGSESPTRVPQEVSFEFEDLRR